MPALRAGFRLEPVPGPALLGPAVRRLLPLPADLARVCSDAPDRVRTGPWSGAAVHRSSRLPGTAGRVVASAPTWLPLPCPRTESQTAADRRRPPPASLARGAERDHRPSADRRRAPSATASSAGPATRPSQERAGPRPARRHEAVPERQARAARRRPRHPRGRLRLPRRAVGRRQVDAHQAAHPRRARDARRGRPRRPGPRPAAAPPGPEDAAQDRDHLPGLQAPADARRSGRTSRSRSR